VSIGLLAMLLDAHVSLIARSEHGSASSLLFFEPSQLSALNAELDAEPQLTRTRAVLWCPPFMVDTQLVDSGNNFRAGAFE